MWTYLLQSEEIQPTMLVTWRHGRLEAVRHVSLPSPFEFSLSL